MITTNLLLTVTAAEYVGDYVFSGGDYVPVDGEGE